MCIFQPIANYHLFILYQYRDEDQNQSHSSKKKENFFNNDLFMNHQFYLVLVLIKTEIEIQIKTFWHVPGQLVTGKVLSLISETKQTYRTERAIDRPSFVTRPFNGALWSIILNKSSLYYGSIKIQFVKQRTET